MLAIAAGAVALIIVVSLLRRGCGCGATDIERGGGSIAESAEGEARGGKPAQGAKPAKGAKESAAAAAEKALKRPVRDKPESFPRNTSMPSGAESAASGSIASVDFSAGRDLVYVDDARVWWESDNDGDTDDECDHSMHVAMVEPFKRLVNLVAETKWMLKVQECYRPIGTHAARSLHKQGRAIDVTVGHRDNPDDRLPADEMREAYEELAKLAWQAGFDWVLYEYKAAQGPHVHASVKAPTHLLKQGADAASGAATAAATATPASTPAKALPPANVKNASSAPAKTSVPAQAPSKAKAPASNRK